MYLSILLVPKYISGLLAALVVVVVVVNPRICKPPAKS